MYRKLRLLSIYLLWVAFCMVNWHCHSHNNPQNPGKKDTPDWIKDLSLYEIHINVYTREGSFKSLLHEIPRINKLGVRTIALAPYPWCDTLVLRDLKKNRFALTGNIVPEVKYGSSQDFSTLIDSLHQKNIKVIIEWNASSLSKLFSLNNRTQSMLIKESPHDTFNSECVLLDLTLRSAQEKSKQYILEFANAYKVDGFLLFNTEKSHIEFYQSLSIALNKIRPMLLINGGMDSPKEMKDLFHLSLNYELENRILSYYKTMDPSKLENYIDSLSRNTHKHVNFFYSFHEQLYTGSDINLFGNYHKMLAALVQFLPGAPMIYNGQEVPVYVDIKPDKGINIEFAYDFMGDFYRTFFLQKQNNSALWISNADNTLTSISTTPGVLAFERKNGNSIIVGFFNLYDRPVTFTISKDYHSFYYLNNKARVNFVKGVEYKLGPGYHIIITNTL